MFYKSERTAIIIDGVNLHGVARALGFEIDYRKLREDIAQRCRLVRSDYYTTILEQEDFSPIRPLVDWLAYNGFRVHTKSAREFTDQSGRRKIKGSIHVEITVDSLALARHVDHIILFSGDGELRAMVAAVQREGCRVTVCSSLKTTPPMVSDDLRRQADDFIDFDDLRSTVTRPPRDT